jgi:hypothetical protein
MAGSVAYKSPPIQPGVAPDPNFLMRDLDFQFMQMVRSTPVVSNWHTRFAWMPSMAFPSLRVDMPVDLSSFMFEGWTGIPTFKKGTNVKIRHEIAPFWAGTYVNARELVDPASAELIAFERRGQALFSAWDRHLPPKIYAMLNAGQEALSAPHPVTGGVAFFGTNAGAYHLFNVGHPEYGGFDNLIGDGGANADTPIYAILEGGSFDMMRPWSILKGSNMANVREAAAKVSARSGVTTGGAGGEPWIIHWGADDDKTLVEQNFEVRAGVYAERGYGLLFPHSIIRFEGTLDYAGLLSIVDAAGDMKDLNGYMQADQTRVSAFLCHTTAQKSTINGILGRDITDTDSTGVKIDSRLKSAEIIVMSR